MKKNSLITTVLIILCNVVSCQTEKNSPKMSDKKYNSLTTEEERIIVNKGTKLFNQPSRKQCK